MFPEAFLQRIVVRDDGCWCWVGFLNLYGYGRFKRKLAHRWSCEHVNGPPPFDDAVVMHRCDRPACVNPEHLSWGSRADNMRDASLKGRFPNRKKTHCPQGHAYLDANLRRDGRSRRCRICANEQLKKSRIRNYGSLAAFARIKRAERKARKEAAHAQG